MAHPHDTLVDPIRDCQAVLAAGMGRGHRARLQAAGLSPVASQPGPIDAAVLAFAAGRA